MEKLREELENEIAKRHHWEQQERHWQSMQEHWKENERQGKRQEIAWWITFVVISLCLLFALFKYLK